MDLTLLREGVTVVSFVTFVSIIVYALAPGNRRRFEQAAWMAVEDDGAMAFAATAEPTLSPTLPQGAGSERGARFREEEA